MTEENLTACGSDLIGRSIRILPVVTSTNDLLKAEAELGKSDEGAVLITEHQSAGRGRLDRCWESQPGKSLLFSILLTPETKLGNPQLIGLLTSLGLLEGLINYFQKETKETGFPHEIIRLKWPNDLMVKKRKLCGILSDAGVDVRGRTFVVVGIGLNVNQSLNDFPKHLRNIAASLYLLTGRIHLREKLLKAIITSIEKHYLRLKAEGVDWIPETWLDRAGIKGKYIGVGDSNGRFYGIRTGLGDDGALKLRLDDGTHRTIYSGDTY